MIDLDRDKVSHLNQDLTCDGTEYLLVAPDGSFVLAQAKGTGRVIDLRSGEIRYQVPVSGWSGPQISSDSTAIATFNGSAVEVRQSLSGELLGTIPNRSMLLSNANHVLGPSGRFIIMQKGGVIGAFETASGQLLQEFSILAPNSCALSGDGRFVLFGGNASPVNDGFFTLFDVRTGEIIEDHSSAYEIEYVDIAYDGSFYALSDMIGLWLSVQEDVPELAEKAQVFGFCQNGRSLIAMSDHTLVRWECRWPESVECFELEATFPSMVHMLSTSTDGNIVALTFYDGVALMVPRWKAV